MIAWWNGRTARERWMLAILAGLLVIVILWLGGLKPLTAWADEAARRRADAAAAEVAVDRALAEMAAIRSKPVKPLGKPLEAVVSETAAAAGVALDRVEADPSGGVRIAIEGADAKAVFPWIARLQTEYGVAAQSLTALKEDGALVLEATFVQASAA